MGFQIKEVGKVVQRDGRTFIEIMPEFEKAISGLNPGDRILLFLWFHRSDTPSKRAILQVHPYGNRQNPLTGVFATRSPVRPNPIGFYAVRIIKITDRSIEVTPIDAYDGTPVVDIKIFVERLDCPGRFDVDESRVNIRKGFQVGALNFIPSGDGRLIVELKGETEILGEEEIKRLKEFVTDL